MPDRRRSDEQSGWLDAFSFVGDVGLDDLGAWLLAAAVVLIVVVLAWFLLFPILVFALDLVVFVSIAAGGIAIKVLFRRPWLIESRTDGPPAELHTWGIVGVRASAQAVDTVADALRRGTPPDQIRPAPRFR